MVAVPNGQKAKNSCLGDVFVAYPDASFVNITGNPLKEGTNFSKLKTRKTYVVGIRVESLDHVSI